ncbi:GDSL lipase/acylhydrolase [Gloeopeniophorella convolvens]|nr:GDSL lipase/acylhydrolase [Gloeopeniophorella convolvens]
MTLLALLSCLAAGLASSALAAHGPLPGQIKNLATFGDSYTDVVVISNGGTQWPVYAAGYAHVNLFPFARSGAPCDQTLTPRPFPAVVQDEIPTYLAEVKNGTIRVPPAETLYTLWIGTNDLGPNTLITGGVLKNATVVDVTSCAVNWVHTLYNAGARNFLFQNMLPSGDLPLYAVDSWPNRYWTQSRNTTDWNLFITEMTVSYNAIAKLMLQALPSQLPGAHVGLFDSHTLFADMFARPQLYLNGTAPLNVTGAVRACVFNEFESTSDTGACTIATGSAKDSFLWFDELHPSEQADRVVAREIANIIEGKGSKFAAWFS